MVIKSRKRNGKMNINRKKNSKVMKSRYVIEGGNPMKGLPYEPIKKYKPPAPPTPNSIEKFNMQMKVERAKFADYMKKIYEEEPHLKN